MSTGSALAIYFVIWWIVLFAVLPWGVRSQSDAGDIVPGSDPGAPHRPRFGRIVLATTALSALVFAGIYALIVQDIVSLEDLTWLPGAPRPAAPR